jgi:hypothetical protein
VHVSIRLVAGGEGLHEAASHPVMTHHAIPCLCLSCKRRVIDTDGVSSGSWWRCG